MTISEANYWAGEFLDEQLDAEATTVFCCWSQKKSSLSCRMSRKMRALGKVAIGNGILTKHGSR
jgi:hypothetical protein